MILKGIIMALEEDILSQPQTKVPPNRIIFPMVAAILMLFIIPVTLLGAGPYAVISLDINPSIELVLSKSGTIKSITGKNLDLDDMTVEELIQFLKSTNTQLLSGEALDELLDELNDLEADNLDDNDDDSSDSDDDHDDD